MKQLLLALAVLGLMIRGYFMYQKNQLPAAHQVVSAHQVASQPGLQARNADAEADSAAFGEHRPAPPPAAKAPATLAKAPAAAAPATAAANDPRPEIEAALREMHVTTIMPGSPGVFILGKQDYSEGEDLPLPKGRKARVLHVENDGVQLSCEGMAFHLDPPVAPDLAALRKKKP